MKKSSANLKTKAAGEYAEVMTVPTLAEFLHCHQSTIYRLLKEKRLPAFKLGSDWRFFRSAIDGWIVGLYDTTNPAATRGPKSKIN